MITNTISTVGSQNTQYSASSSEPSLTRGSGALSLRVDNESADDSFEVIQQQPVIQDNNYTCISPKVIENRKDPEGIKPENFSRFGTIKEYLENYLLNKVNCDGKPPLLLRPLAALLALLGIHGFGQTNCASCATAFAETFEKNNVYLAMPELRGADVKGKMGLPTESCCSVTELISELRKSQPDDALNGILVIYRPALWRFLPGATQGHVCNVIKFKDSKLIHFFDTQKKTYVECDLDNIAGKCAEISKFLGSIGDGGIELYKTAFHEDINKKAGTLYAQLNQ
ncbi:hypothetical protein V2A85_07975 [Yersinia sp. 1252 StPb PI]|uniref:hypothetical protein n=1 Tax=Yersinia sp. 1252 StPb PI TaxID=3117404 RepID=UPI003B28D933